MLLVFLVLVAQGGAWIVPVSQNNKTFYKTAAAVTNSDTCTDIALEIMSEDGSIADAAIAALLCEGVTNPQSMGIGGGFLLTIYNQAEKKVEMLNAREGAPGAATENMFGKLTEKDISSGGLGVAIPGELMGYWELHKKYGRMSWYDLFRPAIELCRKGMKITAYTGKMIAKLRDEILLSPTMKRTFTNAESGELYQEGDVMVRPILGCTLELVALLGPEVLYKGNLTKDFVADIVKNGGIITEKDLGNYRATWSEPLVRTLGDYNFHTANLPGAGAQLLFILEVMLKKMSDDKSKFWHRLVETWKFSYGFRAGWTGPTVGTPCNYTGVCEEDIQRILKKIHEGSVYQDPRDYGLERPAATEDHGTSHLCFLAPNGDAISVTSTINLSFGALFISESTGIILNDEMIDFSVPNHYNFDEHAGNRIAPNRQPMSSMLPTIVTEAESGKLRLVIGSAGGFKIITSVSLVILLHLYDNMELEQAILEKRLHHQLNPMVLEYECGFEQHLLDCLKKSGNCLKKLGETAREFSSSSMAMHSAVNAIAVVDGKIRAVADPRRKGDATGY